MIQIEHIPAAPSGGSRHLQKRPKTDRRGAETVIQQMPVDDFFAQGGKVREDGRMVHDMDLMRIRKPEESTQRWDLYEYLSTEPGDEAFRPMAEGGCPYLAK